MILVWRYGEHVQKLEKYKIFLINPCRDNSEINSEFSCHSLGKAFLNFWNSSLLSSPYKDDKPQSHFVVVIAPMPQWYISKRVYGAHHTVLVPTVIIDILSCVVLIYVTHWIQWHILWQVNVTVTSLCLDGNAICNKGLRYISWMLTENVSINTLVSVFFWQHNRYRDIIIGMATDWCISWQAIWHQLCILLHPTMPPVYKCCKACLIKYLCAFILF